MSGLNEATIKALEAAARGEEPEKHPAQAFTATQDEFIDAVFETFRGSRVVPLLSELDGEQVVILTARLDDDTCLPFAVLFAEPCSLGARIASPPGIERVDLESYEEASHREELEDREPEAAE